MASEPVLHGKIDANSIEDSASAPLADRTIPRDHVDSKEPIDDPATNPATGSPSTELARNASGREQLAHGVSPEGAGVHVEHNGNGTRASGPGASQASTDSTQPLDATRELQSSSGALTYTEVAETLAVHIADCLDALFDKAPEDISITPNWIRDLHFQLAGELFPEWGGRFRITDVQVGGHLPPPAYAVAVLINDFCLDLDERLRYLAGAESIAEFLAWVDWRFQWIHPFKDFNGRVGRILLVALAYKLGLPPTDPAVTEQDETRKTAYFAALRKADSGDLSPLKEIWLQRLAY